jgi:hypothetical protein
MGLESNSEEFVSAGVGLVGNLRHLAQQFLSSCYAPDTRLAGIRFVLRENLAVVA